MCLEVCRVDHECVGFATQIGRLQAHPGEDLFLAPSLPAAVESCAAYRHQMHLASASRCDDIANLMNRNLAYQMAGTPMTKGCNPIKTDTIAKPANQRTGARSPMNL